MLEPSTLKSSLNSEPLPVFFASSSLFPDLPTFKQSSGTLNLQTPSGKPQETLSIAQLSTDSSNSLKQIQGSLVVDLGSDRSAQDVVASIRNWVKEISGTVPFADGKIDVDLPTPTGLIKGSIEFGNGALISNLATPSGDYFSSIDFKPSDQYPFNFNGIPGVVNFNDGLVILDFQPQIQDDEIAIPINALSGNVAFKDGQAALNIPTPLGVFATHLDLSALVKSIEPQGSGTVKVQNGIATIETTGDFGTIQTALDLPKLAQDAGASLATIAGTVHLTNDVTAGDLKTSIS